MKDDSSKANEQVFHHDEDRKRQDDFSVDVRNLSLLILYPYVYADCDISIRYYILLTKYSDKYIHSTYILINIDIKL